jgi:hypothetical protein
MLTALVLICSLNSTPDLQSCNRDTAVDAVRVPEAFANPVTCFMHGQAYLAETSLGRDIGENERVKIVCVRATPPSSPNVDAAQATPPQLQ